MLFLCGSDSMGVLPPCMDLHLMHVIQLFGPLHQFAPPIPRTLIVSTHAIIIIVIISEMAGMSYSLAMLAPQL